MNKYMEYEGDSDTSNNQITRNITEITEKKVFILIFPWISNA